MADQLVLTPGGYRPASQVHLVPPGHVIDGSGGRIRQLDATGKLVNDFGAVPLHTTTTPLMPGNVLSLKDALTKYPGMALAVPPPPPAAGGAPGAALFSAGTAPGAAGQAAVVPGLGTGWIIDGDWTAGGVITSFTTTWVVPPPPSTQSGQTIFLFNGIQNASFIYQPVLQWGGSAAGGGNYWAVASWYADGQGGPSLHSTLTRVDTGTVLTGVMTLTGQSSAGFSYSCEFTGIAASSQPVQNIPELTWFIQTLEAYGVQRATDYPRTAKTSMTAIEIKTSGPDPSVNWQAQNRVTDVGQHAVVVRNTNPGGQVDLYYSAPNYWETAIAATSWSANRLDIFGLGTDNQMYHKAWTGSAWSPSVTGWEPLGGVFHSQPAVVSWAANRLDIFGLGTDNQMYHKAWTGSAWSPSATGWEPLGGVFHSQPAVVSWAANRLDIFGLGTDNQMYHKAWTGSAWSPSATGWEPLGGVFDSPPAVVSWAANRLDIFGLGTDNQMYHKAWTGSAWSPSATGWEPLGGVFDSMPAVVSWGPNRIDIFGLGTDNQMYHKAWTGSAWSPSATGWEPLGGVFDSMPAVVSWAPNRLDIFGLGTDGQMYHKAWTGSAWSPSATGWEPLGGVFRSAPAVASWSANRLDIFGLGTDFQMYHKAWTGSAWSPSATGWEPLGGVFNLPIIG